VSENKKPVWYENKIKRNSEYNKQNMKQVKIAFNIKTEAEILQHLEQIPNKSGYIKQLIIEDIAKKNI
jgi:hypothetical protein